MAIEKCPFCGSRNIVKNGHLKSNGKQRWLCKSSNCKKSFSETSIRKFPKTHLPFPVICLSLYFYDDGESISNHILPCVNMYLEERGKKKISLSTFYSWKQKYGKTYSDMISRSEAYEYYYLGYFFEDIDFEIDENKFPKYNPEFIEEVVEDYEIVDYTPIESRHGKNKNNPKIRTYALLKLLEDELGVKKARELVRRDDWKDYFKIEPEKHTLIVKRPKIIFVKNEGDKS